MTRHPFVACSASVALMLGPACTRNVTPCASPACAAGHECLANTCTPVGSEPVPKDTTRIVLEPTAVAGANASEARGGSVDLARSGAALYLRFDTAWKRDGSVVRAFLLLEPAESTEEVADASLDVWTVQAPWSPSRVAIGARPNLGQPHARGLLRSTPPATARVDVTRVALALAAKPDDDGMAVLFDGPERTAAVMTGSSGGVPKLELYVRRAR